MKFKTTYTLTLIKSIAILVIPSYSNEVWNIAFVIDVLISLCIAIRYHNKTESNNRLVKSIFIATSPLLIISLIILFVITTWGSAEFQD